MVFDPPVLSMHYSEKKVITHDDDNRFFLHSDNLKLKKKINKFHITFVSMLHSPRPLPYPPLPWYPPP